MITSLIRIPTIVAGVILLSHCSNTSHLLVYQHSNFGLNVSSNPSTQKVHARLGIRNEIAVITPKTRQAVLDSNGEPETTTDKNGNQVAKTKLKAVSSYVSSRFRVVSIYRIPEVAEVVATGKAATSIGKSRGSAAFLTVDDSSGGGS